ncbi:hypothetical protein ACWEOI_09510 [Nocardia sp. NPDC004340]|uniref:hypothetical protein n=1 Tax=Nocardia sp. CA-136227 TaxID=3239979 RepID=UPI003D9625EB
MSGGEPLPPEYAEMWARGERQELDAQRAWSESRAAEEQAGHPDSLTHEDWYEEEFGSRISAPPNW